MQEIPVIRKNKELFEGDRNPQGDNQLAPHPFEQVIKPLLKSTVFSILDHLINNVVYILIYVPSCKRQFLVCWRGKIIVI